MILLLLCDPGFLVRFLAYVKLAQFTLQLSLNVPYNLVSMVES